MNQSKLDSAIEAITNILIGAMVALIAQLVWFPIIGKEFTMGENLLTTAFFTVVSFVRSYSLRRLFNFLSLRQWIKSKLGDKI